MARAGIVAGETGAAGLAGLIELLTGRGNTQHREALGIDERSCALIFVTEGATDPASYGRIVSRRTRLIPIVASSGNFSLLSP